MYKMYDAPETLAEKATGFMDTRSMELNSLNESTVPACKIEPVNVDLSQEFKNWNIATKIQRRLTVTNE